MREAKVRLQEIASKAGVHVSTVSKALRHSNDLNEETSRKIRQIAGELNYPMPSATGAKRTISALSIGVICPGVSSNYYSQLVHRIQQHAAARGVQMYVAFSNFDIAQELESLAVFVKNGTAGIVWITESHELEEPLRKVWNLQKSSHRRAPIVVVAPKATVNDCDYICVDDEFGTTLAVEHLIALKHTRIAYIGDRLSMDRLAAYKATLTRNGIPVDPALIRVRPDRFEDCGYRGMLELLSSRRRPTALLAAYDDIALGVMRAAFEKGIRIPEDLSLVGIDDIRLCPFMRPSLTSVAGPIAELGQLCIETLLRKIEVPRFRAIQHITLKPRLVVRDSSRKLGP